MISHIFSIYFPAEICAISHLHSFQQQLRFPQLHGPQRRAQRVASTGTVGQVELQQDLLTTVAPGSNGAGSGGNSWEKCWE